nr:unnamed protein product [Callosobruchus analis]
MTAVLQINLHHSRAAMATLCQKILADTIGVVLIQEPWTVKGRVMGMSTAKDNDLCSRDIAVTEVHLQTGDGSIRILFASVYLPYDSVEAPPITAMKRTVEYGVNRGKYVIRGLDANAHHVAWGSTNANRRELNLSLINQGCKPTFQQKRGNILSE